MKALLCCCTFPDEKLGAAKVYLGLKKLYEQLGHEVDLVSPATFSSKPGSDEYFILLKDFINKRGHNYDFIEYEHNTLPFERSEFSNSILLVARIVLLSHFSLKVKMYGTGLLGELKNLASNIKNFNSKRKIISNATKTLSNADLIFCSNGIEEIYLKQELPLIKDKIFLNPFGLMDWSQDNYNNFRSEKNTVLFLGTLDPRKGVYDLPFIFSRIHSKYPTIKFKLLGTGFYLDTLEKQYNVFSDLPKDNITIIPEFAPEDLEKYLPDVILGVFPSRVEGCPFAVLEQFKFSIPVFGYDSPGVSMLLPNECLAKSNSKIELANVIIDYLSKPDCLHKLGDICYRIGRSNFSWPKFAKSALQHISMKLPG